MSIRRPPVQAIVGTLLTTLVGLAVAAFFNRRRIAWRAYIDAPITLDAGLAKPMGSRVIHKVYVTDDGGRMLRNGGSVATPAQQEGPHHDHGGAVRHPGHRQREDHRARQAHRRQHRR